MAYVPSDLSVVVNNVKAGVVPSHWIYYNRATDTVTAAGFFTDARLAVGDQITVLVAAFTSTALYRVSAVSEQNATVVASGNVVVTAAGVQSLSGAGAVDIVNGVTLWTTTGANAGTLADGAEGQRKIVKCIVDGGAGTLTPTNLLDGTTLTFTEVNDAVELVFAGATWNVVANNGVVVA